MGNKKIGYNCSASLWNTCNKHGYFEEDAKCGFL